MLKNVLGSRLGIAVVAGVLAAGAASGISVAIASVRNASPDLYYACVGTAGTSLNKVRGAIRLNTPPASCPSTTDVVKSWNAVGTQGIAGPEGPMGPQGPAGDPADVAGTSTALDLSVGVVGNKLVTKPVDTSACADVSVRWKGRTPGSVSAVYFNDAVGPNMADIVASIPSVKPMYGDGSAFPAKGMSGSGPVNVSVWHPGPYTSITFDVGVGEVPPTQAWLYCVPRI